MVSSLNKKIKEKKKEEKNTKLYEVSTYWSIWHLNFIRKLWNRVGLENFWSENKKFKLCSRYNEQHTVQNIKILIHAPIQVNVSSFFSSNHSKVLGHESKTKVYKIINNNFL